MSHLLVKPQSAAGEFDFDAPRDYLPDPNVDWVVTFEFDQPVKGTEITKLLDIPWQKDHGLPTIYGFAPSENHWTFVNAKDAPDEFTRLKIAWTLWDAIEEKPKDVTANDFERYKLDAEMKLSELGSNESKVERSIEGALTFIGTLPDLMAECNQDVTLKLVAPEGRTFAGRDVWDVMLCLGLDYGDGDLFHWINNSGFGDDHFFTVETSTPPGYFIPRRMASGEGDVDDLIFNFSIPRSADPVAVFDSMANAVEYAQDRLGGQVLVGNSKPFGREAERENIKSIGEKLKAAGFVPGESATCRVF
jgi:cell division protein ZipA